MPGIGEDRRASEATGAMPIRPDFNVENDRCLPAVFGLLEIKTVQRHGLNVHAQPPPSSAMRMFLPAIILLSIAISPHSFIKMARRCGTVAIRWRSSVVLPLPGGPVIIVRGVRPAMF